MSKKNLNYFNIDLSVIADAEKKVREGFACFTYDAAYTDAKREGKPEAELNGLAELVIFAKMQTGIRFIKC